VGTKDDAAHLGRARLLQLGVTSVGNAERSEVVIVAAPGPSLVGAQLDGDHLPETNGRMSVCRRCGAATDAAGAHHAPNEHQAARSTNWLMAEKGRKRAARAQELLS